MTQETDDVVARWSLQFSNIPPHVAIWSAKPGHDPRRDCVALLEDGADRHTIGEAFEALTVRHNRELQSQSARIAELEGLVKLAQQLGPRAAQLMDSIRQEWSQSGDWTEWDQQVRDETTAMMRAIDASLTKDSTSG